MRLALAKIAISIGTRDDLFLFIVAAPPFLADNVFFIIDHDWLVLRQTQYACAARVSG